MIFGPSGHVDAPSKPIMIDLGSTKLFYESKQNQQHLTILFSEVLKFQKNENVAQGTCRTILGILQFVNILNMGSVFFKTHEMNILGF